jgi:WD40 repeat protein
MEILTRKLYYAPYPHYHLRHNIRLTLLIGDFCNLVLHLQGNLFAFGTGDGNVLLLDVSITRLLNLMQSQFATVGALAWNENVLSSGTSDSSILQRDVRSHSHVTERRLLRHRREVSRNELRYY